jgi:hypothetical protein
MARRWIVSKNVIFVLMYHRHKPLDLVQEQALNIEKNLGYPNQKLEDQQFTKGKGII